MRRLALTLFGPPARRALAGIVAEAQAGDPLAPVTVAVPSTYCGLSLRRGRRGVGPGETGGLVNVRFVSLNRVAELLGAPFLAQTRVPLTAEAAREAVRRALIEAGGRFAGVAHHPATLRSLVETVAELRTVPEAELDRLADTGPRARAVVDVYRRVRSLSIATYDDEDQLLSAARWVAAHDPGPTVGCLVLHLPVELTPGGLALVEAFARRGRAAAVLGLTGEAEPDRETHALAERLAPVLGLPERPDPGVAPSEPGCGAPQPAPIHLVRNPDPDTEVREVVRALARRLEKGHPLAGAAVAYRVASPYLALAHTRLAEAGMPVHGPSPYRVRDTRAGRVLSALLTITERGTGGGPRRADVAALVAAAPVPARPGGPPARAALWDRVSRRAGIVGGLDEWQTRLGHHRDRLDADPLPDPDAQAARLATIDELEAFVVELARLTPAPPVGTWAEGIGWARGLVERYAGRPGPSWSPEDVQGHEVLDTRLRALAALDGADPVPIDAATLRAALAEVLDAGLGHVGRFGDGVLVAPIGALRGLDLDLVLVVGGAEGRLPPIARDDPLLPDRDRRVAGATLAIRAGAPALARERRAFLAAIAAAREVVVVSWASAEPMSRNEQLPSRWLARVAATRAGRPVGARELAGAAAGALPGVTVVPSFAAAVQHGDGVGSRTEWDLRTLARWRATGHPLGEHPIVTADPVLHRGWRLLRARASPRCTEYDGLVGPRPGLKLDGDHPLSPSRIEAWATCPFQYFLANVVRVERLDPPEARERLDSRHRGWILHTVLERFVREHLDRPPDAPWDDAAAAQLDAIASDVFREAEDRGITGRRILWDVDKRRIRAELRRALRADERIRAETRARPAACEVGFGHAGDPWPPLTVPLAGGRRVTFQGRIDRVDVSDDGTTLTVYDYKTGRVDGMQQLAQDPVAGGTRLQLAVYALAAEAAHPGRRVRISYWHTRQRLGSELTTLHLHELRDRAVHALATVAEGIAGGVFPAVPGAEDSYFRTFENCRHCDFDALCPASRDRLWRAKRGDPHLEPYHRLTPLEEAGA